MIGMKELTKLAAALGGLPVIGCRADSPAARAGVSYGDVVLSVNGMATPDWSAFVEARGRSSTSMSIELFRDGEHVHLEFALDQHAPIDPPQLLAELISEHVVALPMPERPKQPN